MEGMNCSEARQALWPPERPRLAEAEVLEASRHVQGCPAVENDPEVAGFVHSVASRVVGLANIPSIEPATVGDDMALFPGTG